MKTRPQDPSGCKTIVSIECRMTSTRLPGKVMYKSCGKPLLELMIERIRLLESPPQIVLATTTNASDDVISELAERLGVLCYRGSEDDVLLRVFEAASTFEAELIVELTGDCPLIDPGLILQALQAYHTSSRDYVSNCDLPGLPNGMNVQVFSRMALAIAVRDGKLHADREHVSWYIRRNPELFSKLFLQPPPMLRWPELRLTVDELGDFKLVNAVFEHFYPRVGPKFSCEEIIHFLKENPSLLKFNEDVQQKRVV